MCLTTPEFDYNLIYFNIVLLLCIFTLLLDYIISYYPNRVWDRVKTRSVQILKVQLRNPNVYVPGSFRIAKSEPFQENFRISNLEIRKIRDTSQCPFIFISRFFYALRKLLSKIDFVVFQSLCTRIIKPFDFIELLLILNPYSVHHSKIIAGIRWLENILRTGTEIFNIIYLSMYTP